MIQKIRLRFIALAMAALFFLLAAIVTGMNLVNFETILEDADAKLELLSGNEGDFPDFDGPRKKRIPRNMTLETPYETRYFSVLFSPEGQVLHTDTKHIRSVDKENAVQYALQARESGKCRGFLDHYRFMTSEEDSRVRILFLDCSRDFASFRSFFLISICMALVGYAGFFFVILFFSGRLLRPVTESYEKQRQFITDAGHEIKTPLAVIQADVDVLEMEYGKNEWLEGIQSQVKRLSVLTSDLVYLSRMEETREHPQMIEFPFSDVVSETAHSFLDVAQAKGKQVRCTVEPMLSLEGDEKSIRQLVSILLDNALKYSPDQGIVSLSAEKQGKYLHLTVFNTTIDPVEQENLSRIFERFYRLDASRSSKTGGYGIGLSIAKAIVTTHNGKIQAETPDGRSLEIHVQLPL